jgi:hypothetical protein
LIFLGNLNPLRNETFLDEMLDQSQPRPTTDSDYQMRFNQYIGELLSQNMNNKRPINIKSGYQLDDLLIQCTFNGRSCQENLTPFFHPNYGNCYTFDNDIHAEPTRRRNISHIWSIDDDDDGDGYKLFLELFLYQNEYNPHLDDRAAFRIFIHRKHEIPILSQNSLFLGPTTFTKLIFSHRTISFSQQCRNDLTDDMKQTFESNHIKYSQALCFKLCEFLYIQKHCNCIDRLFMVYFQFFTQNQTTRMNTNNSCTYEHTCLLHRKRFSKNFERFIELYFFLSF